MMEAPPFSRLGKYELRGELGRGAMGVVYRAFDLALQREVALKTMAAPSSDQAQTMRFLREARTAGSLHHPNIVTIHELGQASGTYFISMELLKGQSLRDLINSGQLPSIERRLEIVARVCDGLDFAHRNGIVHRDIKPANIFLPTKGSVKILDFGIAKISASEATRTGLVMGTVDYMSPEQVRAVKDLDGRSDIFGAGVILYELLFRRKPFQADDLGAALHRILHEQPPGWSLFRQFLPAELATALQKSLDKRREARFSRAGEMAEALDAVAGSLSPRAGTELAERIDEVVRSGVLARGEPAPPMTAASPDAETKAIGSQEMEPATERVRPANRRRTGRIALGAGLAVIVLAVLLGGRLLTRRAEPPVDDPTVGTPAKPPIVSAPATEPSAMADEPVPSAEVAEEADPAPEVALPTEDPGPAPGAGVADVGATSKPATAAPVSAPDPKPVPPPPIGSLQVLVMPWANVEWIEELATGARRPSEATSPVRIDLPAGRYRLRLTNPYAARPLDVEVVVQGNETTVVRETLPGFDTAQLVREILDREREAP